MVADAGEPTSTCFFARLPGKSLEAAGAERLEKWAAANCVEHALVRDAGGNVALYAMRSSGRTARQFQTLLRTLHHQWGMKLGRLEDKRWLSLLSTEDFQAAVQGARGATEGAEEHASRADIMPRAHAPGSAFGAAGPPAGRELLQHPRGGRPPVLPSKCSSSFAPFRALGVRACGFSSLDA